MTETENINRSAMKGIRVIDASRVLGGPYAGQILADHGADVIKVEPPQGDETRAWGPPFKDDAASYFLGANRNKRGISLDMSKAAGQEVLYRLLENADVFIENFKIGTLDKWGIGSEDLLKRFPRLVHCRVSGFGADGPYGGLPGYDAALQATTGIMSINGAAGGEPVRMGAPIVDMAAGLNAVIGILMALHSRTTSGKGQFVEVTLYDSGLSLLHPHLPNYFLSEHIAERVGNAHPNISPYDTYRTKTTPIFLAVGNDRQFLKLCEVLERPELPRSAAFRSNADRVTNREQLKIELEDVLKDSECKEIAGTLIRLGVPCGEVRSIDEVVNDPHTHHREMVVEVDGHRGTGSPIKLGSTPVSYRRRPPHFAEHTDEVMAEIGINPNDYEDVLPK